MGGPGLRCTSPQEEGEEDCMYEWASCGIDATKEDGGGHDVHGASGCGTGLVPGMGNNEGTGEGVVLE